MRNVQLILDVNGETREVVGRMADTLLHILRHELDLTGAKPGCENGDCGACTVLVEGIPIKSCIMLGVEAVGRQIITIEGLHETPIQQAFEEKWAFQCGYCTPGFIMNCHGLVSQRPDADDHVIEEWLSSNICRCTSYQEIEEAVKSVLEKQRGDSK
ncbi:MULTISPECIES: (2Fe-2S)-binding protein [unclassified Bacillus (in: firmicutes)]|uniref:(2Fe-2S)-binding protein n=1 Tax=unclassified Bacillus (in: firmicutes) TaxID=185979 RepID=UPI0008E4D7FD|nr:MULTISPECIES: (2Fe-2S)-binding protein [unclassified Bacillus (in: firmicutes)]SFJ56926.1 carbon-monoxide dehydrogenase small subunit [Bacillus sp. 71mf]SFT06279.1 carbon-monoxide dehydrogenase small subunit [Bacillus sp. 103mf]